MGTYLPRPLYDNCSLIFYFSEMKIMINNYHEKTLESSTHSSCRKSDEVFMPVEGHKSINFSLDEGYLRLKVSPVREVLNSKV